MTALLALCTIADKEPSRCAGLFVLDQPGDVRILRQPDRHGGDTVEVYRAGADLVLSVPDAFMSSQHAALRRDPSGKLCAEDLGSRNGTRLCGLPLIHGSRPLRHGDVLETGRALWRYVYMDEGSRGQRDDDARDRVFMSTPMCAAADAPASLSPLMRRVLATASRIAGTRVPVLIQGEAGTGKRWLARYLHERGVAAGLSRRITRVAPGGRLPPLSRIGRGTLLIEDVGHLSLGDQHDLLMLLRGEPARARSAEPVQVLAISDIDLSVLVRGGAFRADLLDHLSALTLHLPPLRERREDLGLIVEFCLRRLGAPGALPTTPEVWRCMLAHEWPGNQTELLAAMRHALAVLARRRGARILVEDLPDSVRHGWMSGGPPRAPLLPWVPILAPPDGGVSPVPPGEALEARRQTLIDALTEENGRISAAARRLGLSRVHVGRLARQLGLNLEGFRTRRITRKL